MHYLLHEVLGTRNPNHHPFDVADYMAGGRGGGANAFVEIIYAGKNSPR
jgi:hypothetical protein